MGDNKEQSFTFNTPEDVKALRQALINYLSPAAKQGATMYPGELTPLRNQAQNTGLNIMSQLGGATFNPFEKRARYKRGDTGWSG